VNHGSTHGLCTSSRIFLAPRELLIDVLILRVVLFRAVIIRAFRVTCAITLVISTMARRRGSMSFFFFFFLLPGADCPLSPLSPAFHGPHTPSPCKMKNKKIVVECYIVIFRAYKVVHLIRSFALQTSLWYMIKPLLLMVDCVLQNCH